MWASRAIIVSLSPFATTRVGWVMPVSRLRLDVGVRHGGDVGDAAVHPHAAALGPGGGENETADELRAKQRELMRDEAAQRVAQHVDLDQVS
jgi:hypothetical protein